MNSSPPFHRLTFLREGWCDICKSICKTCGEDANFLTHIGPTFQNLGWQHCGCEECQGKVKRLQVLHTYSLKNLVDEFSIHPCVIRSSGQKEKGCWSFDGDAYTADDKQVWVTVKKDDDQEEILKVVNLETLRSWNEK